MSTSAHQERDRSGRFASTGHHTVSAGQHARISEIAERAAAQEQADARLRVLLDARDRLESEMADLARNGSPTVGDMDRIFEESAIVDRELSGLLAEHPHLATSA